MFILFSSFWMDASHFFFSLSLAKEEIPKKGTEP